MVSREQDIYLSVSTTGTGKTLIADFLVEKNAEANQRLIYTAFIKSTG